MATRDFQSFFLGAIHGVYVWNRALSAAEVQMVYENVIPHSGLVAEYRLKEDIARDSVGLHNGEVVGGRWSS